MSRDQVRSVVVVGGGLAAAHCCATLRGEGYDGRLVLIGAERHLPHERPPLSKGYLRGTEALEKAVVHDETWYADHQVELRLGHPATGLDADAHTVSTAEDVLTYDRLLLATGAVPRRLAMADRSGATVHYLRTVEDADQLRSVLLPGRHLVVLGAGWIGLEVAASARDLGCEVTVVEPASHPLLRVLGPEVAGAFSRLHRAHGVRLLTGAAPVAVAATGGEAGGGVDVTLDDGTTVHGDSLLVGIGAAPSVDVAARGGLHVEDGVVVDQHLRTSHPHVLAAGDVAGAFHPLLGRRLRVEHWDTAIHQGQAAARSILGRDQPYDRLPYFFSDQYDLGMEYVGSTVGGYDEVVVDGDLESLVFTARWLRDGHVVAGMHANNWDATEHLRGAVASGWSEQAGRY